jgi:hypothetical protein
MGLFVNSPVNRFLNNPIPDVSDWTVVSQSVGRLVGQLVGSMLKAQFLIL